MIPQPVRLTRTPGSFVLSAGTVIATDAASRDIGYALADYVAPATGYRLSVRSSGGGGAISIRTDTSLARLGEEGYRLTVTPAAITIRAYKPAGAFYAVQTLRQLLPVEIFRAARVAGVAWRIPSVIIEDSPRFSWRGAHLDCGRHFMPKEFVKKYLDLLALHKLNRFHWHLTEDQGWRIEIKKYPRLTEIGSWRNGTLIGRQRGYADSSQWRFDGVRHGGFYTQDDVREIVAYAAARFITVVPEIEMPGHAQAAIAAYPQLGNTPDTVLVGMRWGVYAHILNPEESTISFMQDVLTEVLALFPGRYVHIGGDEAVKVEWQASPRAQERIRELGLKDEHELQSYMIRRMDEFLTAHGRSLVGWDEILEGGLAPNAVVMSWRGTDGGIAAAQADHDVVMTPTSNTYFDYYQSADTAGEPIAIGGLLPLETVYGYDPVPAVLTPAQARHILGTQAQLWTEYMPNPRKVEYMAFPRLIALAEVAWTPRERKDYADFTARLDTHLKRLAILDVNYRGRE
ncbi:MAG TPA: beta-N-acetylhexosaminidase [Gemmatimonadales bacterium]|nr:beta-N-acetylhexosaminidase [Gemmatimonadales bacterium]